MAGLPHGLGLDDWFARMLETPRGRRIVRDMTGEYNAQLVDTAICDELLDIIDSEWPQALYSRPYALLQAILLRLPQKFFCHGLPQLTSPPQCSRVMAAKDWVRHNTIQDKSYKRYTSGDVSLAYVRRLARSLDIKAKGTMRTKYPFAWVTKAESIDQLRRAHRKSKRTLSNAVQDCLGWDPAKRGAKILEIVYPSDLFTNAPFMPPTWIEGHHQKYYWSARTADNWGMCRNLATQGEGCPEAVHPEVPFTPNFRVKPIGN